MIEKQIIVNGVNVTDCEWLGLYEECKIKSGSCCPQECKDFPNCYYKELQREKIENVKKQRIIEGVYNIISENVKLKHDLDEIKSDYKHLNDLYNQALKDLDILQQKYE